MRPNHETGPWIQPKILYESWMSIFSCRNTPERATLTLQIALEICYILGLRWMASKRTNRWISVERWLYHSDTASMGGFSNKKSIWSTWIDVSHFRLRCLVRLLPTFPSLPFSIFPMLHCYFTFSEYPSLRLSARSLALTLSSTFVLDFSIKASSRM